MYNKNMQIFFLQLFDIRTMFIWYSIKNTHEHHIGNDWMKKLCKDLKKWAMEIIIKKETVLTRKEVESFVHQKNCYICKEKCECIEDENS